MPIFVVHIIDHFLPAFVAEVHVKVRHAHTFRIQKPFEQEVVADGINVGDTHTIGSQTSGAASASGAYRDTLCFGVVDEIKYNQVIVGVAHTADYIDLVIQTLPNFRSGITAVTAGEAFIAQLFEVGLIFHSVRGFKVRQFGHAEFKIKITLFRNTVGVFTGIRRNGKQIVHFVGAFQIEFVGFKLQFVVVLNGLTGLDADQNALHLAILLAEVMGIVGGYQRDTGLPGKANQQRQNLLLLFNAVILDLDVIVSLPEQIVVIQCNLAGFLIIACEQCLRDFACKTGRKTDQAFVMLLQKFLVHPGLGVKTLNEAGRNQLDQVFITGFVFAQQHQMVGAIDTVDLIETGTIGHIDLTADDGLDAGLFRGFVEIHTAIHHTMVGDGDGGLAQLLDPFKNAVDSAGTIQKAVFRVDMQVGKLLVGISHWFSFAEVQMPGAPAFSAGG